MMPGADPSEYGVSASEDRFLEGKVTVFQPRQGFRAGTDSVLLAASLPEMPGGTALDLGCGPGAALLCAAYRLTGMRLTGLEVSPDAADLARRGISANGFSGRAEIVDGTAAHLPAAWENGFDLVFSNPPFFDPGRISPPGEGKAGAYLESLSLEGWIKAMIFACKPRASLVIVHRAAELGALLGALERRTGEITVLPIWPRAGQEAKRVLVTARKGLKRGPVRLLSGLALHGEDGGLTPRAEAALKGAALEWR